MNLADYPFLLFGSAPLGDVCLHTLEQNDVHPAVYISDKTISLEEQLNLVQAHRISFILVAGYGRILKQELLDSVAGQVLNIHPSLLPKYRGPAPVVQAILDGERETGVTVIELDAEVDHGPILAQESYPLVGTETPADLYRILGDKGTRLFLGVIEAYLNDEADALPQNHLDATFTKFIQKNNGLLSPEEPADFLERKVRAYQQWPGAWLMYEGKKLIIHKAHVENDQLIPDEVQPESGKRMSFTAFAAGKRLKPSELLADLKLSH